MAAKGNPLGSAYDAPPPRHEAAFKPTWDSVKECTYLRSARDAGHLAAYAKIHGLPLNGQYDFLPDSDGRIHAIHAGGSFILDGIVPHLRPGVAKEQVRFDNGKPVSIAFPW